MSSIGHGESPNILVTESPSLNPEPVTRQTITSSVDSSAYAKVCVRRVCQARDRRSAEDFVDRGWIADQMSGSSQRSVVDGVWIDAQLRVHGRNKVLGREHSFNR